MPPTASAPPDRPAPPQREPLPAYDSRFGTLAIGVRPANASIVIDGETWEGPSDDEQLIIQVGEGPHRVEVRKEGYEPFTTEVDVERGRTRPLNVSLQRAPGN
jgi:hypothetical protein